MNIKEAKTQIKQAVTAYLSKDEFGDQKIPTERQRPVLLIGPPGIGKTAIMEQIAQELNIGLVSYSMTHHTRQSALGLPFIVTKSYNGENYSITEYTMSEIIASVYDTIENSGYKEGILFLDEINCVSETLMPSMLQFLQYKIFGRHKVPDGWIVVTAGNPPEYNNSVRDFDIVTWDRLKRMDIEPDYFVWKEYAYAREVHPAVLTYLGIKKDDFYSVETTVDGKAFVTARGWVDLSDMIKLYEEQGFKIDETLTAQYIQNRRICKEFTAYYDLFNKYRSDYQIDSILSGEVTQEVMDRAKEAKFDERLSLVGLILDAINAEFTEIYNEEAVMRALMADIKGNRDKIVGGDAANASSALNDLTIQLKEAISKSRAANSISAEKVREAKKETDILETMMATITRERPSDGAGAFEVIKSVFNEYNSSLKSLAAETGSHLTNIFHFCDEAFADGQETVIFVTELTANTQSASFISRYGNEEYFAHNEELLFHERQKELIQEISELGLE